MSSSILNNFHVIKDVFGHAAHKITLVTTMWDDINEERGLQREEELKKDYWHEAMADGAATARFLGTFDSAWSIVGRFFDGMLPNYEVLPILIIPAEAGPVSPTTTMCGVQFDLPNKY